jgi:hypothetical protein
MFLFSHFSIGTIDLKDVLPFREAKSTAFLISSVILTLMNVLLNYSNNRNLYLIISRMLFTLQMQ